MAGFGPPFSTRQKEHNMGIGRRKIIAAACLGIAAASIAGYGAARYLTAEAPAHAAAQKFTCSMHTHIIQDHPGNCPICNMTLSPVVAGAAPASDMASDMVHADAAAQQRLGLQLATAEVSDMAQPVRAYATIAADESTVVSVNPKVEGWLRSVPLQGVGAPIRRGQVLYEIYSPELQQRQREYIDLLTRKDGLLGAGGDSMSTIGNNAAMVGSLSKEKFRSRARLLAADMSAELVDKLEQSRRVQDVIAVRAEHDGVVTELGMNQGNFVNPMQRILAYADYSKVWAELVLYPDQLAWIKQGDSIVLRSGLDRGATQNARVDLSTMQIDPATRSAKLRVALNNARGAFRPGAFADAEIAAARQRALNIPRDALIRTGHGDFVVVAEAGDHFRRVKVQAGIENADAVAILAGLKAGQQVVVNGQFLLDGAASMQAMQARLAGTAPAPAPAAAPAAAHGAEHGHHHGGQP